MHYNWTPITLQSPVCIVILKRSIDIWNSNQFVVIYLGIYPELSLFNELTRYPFYLATYTYYMYRYMKIVVPCTCVLYVPWYVTYSMPTCFFIFYLHCWWYIQNLTLHFGVQRKLTAFSPHKVVHHAVFCKYYAELAKTFFFCLTLDWVRQEVGFCLTHGLCVCPTIFFVILYITCQILFFIQNWMQDYLAIYSHDH